MLFETFMEDFEGNFEGEDLPIFGTLAAFVIRGSLFISCFGSFRAILLSDNDEYYHFLVRRSIEFLFLLRNVHGCRGSATLLFIRTI